MSSTLPRRPSAPRRPRAKRAPAPVRIGVVGLGYWGPNLVRNLSELPLAEVAVTCDLRTDALEAVGRRFPSVLTTTRLEDVLGDETVEAVVVATPVSTHFEVAHAALAAGKHVFVEKPLAGSSAEGAELVRLATRRRKVLMPGHTFLYSPPVEAIRDLIAVGELGEIYFISSSRVNLGLHQADVDVAWDLGPHDFSILRFWLDEMPLSVAATSRSCIIPGTSDVMFVTLEFGSGTIAHVELAWLAPSKLRRTTIVGSRKMVVYDDTSNEPVRIFDSGAMIPDPETFGEYRMTYRTGDIVSPHIPAVEPLAVELNDFCQAIRTGAAPRSHAHLGLDVIRVIEAVGRSLERDGAKVYVDEV